jgi:hypothetical protein
VRVRLTEDSIEVSLSLWQKVLGLMKDIRVPLADVSDASVVQNPVAETKATGLKVGLRIPRLYFVARTIGLDRVFIVSRRVPALSFAVSNDGPLKHVLVSTPEAEQLASRLRGS